MSQAHEEACQTDRWFWGCVLLAITVLCLSVTWYGCVCVQNHKEVHPSLILLDKAHKEVIEAIRQHQGRSQWDATDIKINEMLYSRLDYIALRRSQIALLLAHLKKEREGNRL